MGSENVVGKTNTSLEDWEVRIAFVKLRRKWELRLSFILKVTICSTTPTPQCLGNTHLDSHLFMKIAYRKEIVILEDYLPGYG